MRSAKVQCLNKGIAAEIAASAGARHALEVHRERTSVTLRALITCAAVMLGPARAGAADLQVFPGDTPLKIRGTIGDDTTFVKRIGLMASAAVPELVFRSTDLVWTKGNRRIGREQIVLTGAGKLELAANIPKDVEIKITGVKVPGRYKGTLFFLQPGLGLTAAVTVPIEVSAEASPRLTERKGSEAVKIQLIDCFGLGCTLARWFEPRAFLSSYPLPFDNGSLEAFRITASVNAIGDSTHGSLGGVLSVQSPADVPAQPAYTLSIAIRNPKPLPDHYVGDVQLRMPPDATIRIPLEVNVREGPIIPIAVLVVGLLLGRLLKYMKEKGGPQSDLLLKLYQLEARGVASPADLQILQPMLEMVRTSIYEMQLDAAKIELAAIENRWRLLTALRSLERILELRDEDGVKPILADIRRARTLIANRQDQQAAALVAEIEKLVWNLKPSTPLAPTFAIAATQAEKATDIAAQTARITGVAKPPWHVRLLRVVTGVSAPLRAEVTLWLIRPTLYVLLLIALAIVGMQQLYLKNATFGSDPFSDYFGVLVWAMSSDVAARTLTSLKIGPG